MNLALYKKRIGGKSVGAAHRKNSDMVMEATWYNDLQSKTCYIYDYYHDSEPEKRKNLSPASDPLKTEVEAKYIISQYGTLSKDQVEVHLMFRPSHKCPLEYYADYENRYDMEYPIGLYVDIPDEDGIYRRWMICNRDYEQQFIKYTILPCNYQFVWCKNGTVYKMWGVARLRNSYNSGQWTAHYTVSAENQDSIWLPLNKISQTITYDQRMIVSVLSEEPITWKVTKVEGIHPIGIHKCVIYQDKFNPNVDYVNFETREMIADFYENNTTGNYQDPVSLDAFKVKLSYSGRENFIRVGGNSRTITCVFETDDGQVFVPDNVTWDFLIDNPEMQPYFADSLVTTISDNSCIFKILKNEDLIGDSITIEAKAEYNKSIYSGSMEIGMVFY